MNVLQCGSYEIALSTDTVVEAASTMNTSSAKKDVPPDANAHAITIAAYTRTIIWPGIDASALMQVMPVPKA